MNDTLQRLDQILELYGTSKTRFAAKINMPQSTLNSIYHRENAKAIQTVAKSALRIYADVRPEWLLNGEGPMLFSQLRNEGIDKLIASIAELSETVRLQQQTINELTNKE